MDDIQISQIDIIQIILTIIAISIGAWISWTLFKVQQQMDFNALKERINDLSHKVGAINSSDKVLNRIKISKDIRKLHGTVELLSKDINSLSEKIILEIKDQNHVLLDTVQAKLGRQVEESRSVLTASVERELKNVLPENNEKTIAKLVELAEHAIQTMGQYQRAIMQEESENALSKVKTNVVVAVGEISKETKDLKNKISLLSYYDTQGNTSAEGLKKLDEALKLSKRRNKAHGSTGSAQ